MTTNPLVRESIAWIDEHVDCNNTDVPIRFLDFWLEEDSEEPGPRADALTVFMYGFLLSEEQRLGRLGMGGKRYSEDELRVHYQDWLLKLALARVQHLGHMSVSPLRLFHHQRPEGFVIERRA